MGGIKSFYESDYAVCALMRPRAVGSWSAQGGMRMTIARWKPPLAPTRQEQFLLKRLDRVRKLLGFLAASARVVRRGVSGRVGLDVPQDRWPAKTRCRPRWGRYRKFVARDTAKNPADPFIDSEGYRAYIDTAEAEFRHGVVH